MRFFIGYGWLQPVTNVFLSLAVCSNVATDPSPAETSFDIIHNQQAYEPGIDQLRDQATRAHAVLSMRGVDYATVLTVTEYNFITLEVITYAPDRNDPINYVLTLIRRSDPGCYRNFVYRR